MLTKKVILCKLFLTCIFITLITTSFCQLRKIESKEEALTALKQTIPDSNRQYIYNFLGELYLSKSIQDKKKFDSSFYYLRKAVYLGDSINYDNKEITNESLCLLAQAYSWSGNVSKAKEIYMHVIANCQQHHQKTNEARIWRRMAKVLANLNEWKEVPNYFDKAIYLFGEDKNIWGKSEVMFDKWNFFTRTNNPVAAEVVFQQLLTQAKANNSEYYSQTCFIIATEYRYRGNLTMALQYGLESVKYIDFAKNKNGIHNFYGELAQIYEVLGETEKSIFWYKKCISEREILSVSLYGFYRTISMLVVQLIKAKKEKEGIILLQQFSKRKPPNSNLTKASLAQSFAYCYSSLKQFSAAEHKFLEMINEYKESECNSEILFIGYYDVAKFYIAFNQFTKANFFLKKAIEFGAMEFAQNKDLNLLLFKVDSANGNPASALKYYQKYTAINDSLFNEAKSKQINELTIRYESEKKDNNIKILETESILQHGKVIQANQTRNWMLGVAILLLIITCLLINNSRVKQQTNKKLHVQQKEIQNKNSSLQHLVKEKDWLVKEIHHRVKNNLHTIIGLLHTQSGFLKSSEALLAINDSQHRIQTMSLIHEKLFQSGDLSTIEMSGYIHELVNYLKHSFDTGQQILFKVDTEELELKLSHSLPLGLILNEAITNSIKYAFPANSNGTITISLKHLTGQQYLLSIADNGKGLPADFDLEKSSSMGMSLMAGLSEDMRGSFTIKNNKGTEITILFSYDSFIIDDLIFHEDLRSIKTI